MKTVKSGLAGSPCIKLFACIEDHTQPGGERRIELGVLEPDNIRMLVQGAERIPTVFTDIASALMAFLNTNAPLIARAARRPRRHPTPSPGTLPLSPPSRTLTEFVE